MAMTPRLELRQGQALVMTPQLQQAIKLLQLNNLELSAYVENELEQNPLLERDDDSREPGEAAESGADAEGAAEAVDGMEVDNLSGIDLTDNLAGGAGEEALDVDYDNVWNNDSASDGIGADPAAAATPAFDNWGSPGSGGFDDGESDLEQTLSEEISLRDHLLRQLSMDITDPAERVIGAYLVDAVDESGYIDPDIASVAEVLGCEVERVEAVLMRLQQFDPPGILARDLRECLALQLRDRDRLDPAMAALLDHLPLLGRHEYAELMRVCGVDAEDLRDMIGELKALNPKPASAFDHLTVQPVTPDIFMRPKAGGGWIIELNNDTLPRVLVNNQYLSQVSRTARNREDRHYINNCLQSANWLVKSLHQRATTILKVATEIVRQQERFFTHGIQNLRPLVLRDIAEAIEMHESTVSRVTSNKYMATPRGIYELKYFFTTSLSSSTGGDSHSSEWVRHRIKALCDEEPPAGVLSDDRITDMLRDEGVEIARRTVAKYRESLGIPSSMQRRRQKSARL